MLPKDTEIKIEKLNGFPFENSGSQFYVVRFDQIHPVVSGNKLYKLHHFIEQAKKENINTIVTAGGAFSNHLAATAYHTNQLGLKSIGLVRGEWNNDNISHTLSYCQGQNMALIPVERDDYAKLDKNLASVKMEIPTEHFLYIPEGGYHPNGAEGATWMMHAIAHHQPTHIILAVGTCTTLAGMAKAAADHVEIIGIPVLKGMEDEKDRIQHLIGDTLLRDPVFFKNYHFGGYAKNNSALLDFMQDFYAQTGIPTDFVYTGKMMFALQDLVQKKYFPPQSKVLAIHTGGLQGNFSLPKGRLNF